MLLLRPDVMVLNDIIEQAAGRHSRASDHGGKLSLKHRLLTAAQYWAICN